MANIFWKTKLPFGIFLTVFFIFLFLKEQKQVHYYKKITPGDGVWAHEKCLKSILATGGGGGGKAAPWIPYKDMATGDLRPPGPRLIRGPWNFWWMGKIHQKFQVNAWPWDSCRFNYQKAEDKLFIRKFSNNIKSKLCHIKNSKTRGQTVWI